MWFVLAANWQATPRTPSSPLVDTAMPSGLATISPVRGRWRVGLLPHRADRVVHLVLHLQFSTNMLCFAAWCVIGLPPSHPRLHHPVSSPLDVHGVTCGYWLWLVALCPQQHQRHVWWVGLPFITSLLPPPPPFPAPCSFTLTLLYAHVCSRWWNDLDMLEVGNSPDFAVSCWA